MYTDSHPFTDWYNHKMCTSSLLEKTIFPANQCTTTTLLRNESYLMSLRTFVELERRSASESKTACHEKLTQQHTCARLKVRRARTTKLVPPAKSVTLSNLQAYAMMKKSTCMATVTTAHIARLLSSHRYTGSPILPSTIKY